MGPAGEFLDSIDGKERALLAQLFAAAADPFA
jgi:hypothetical protein